MIISKFEMIVGDKVVDLTDSISNVTLGDETRTPRKRCANLSFEAVFQVDDVDGLIRALLFPMQTAWHSVN